MIHYVATTVSGGYLKYAFQDGDHGVILARGADLTRYAPCTGHSLHSAAECVGPGCSVIWSEPVGQVWEKRGFRWVRVKEERA
jgi:hypothetical protein